jgi:hypothetical protein
MNSALARRVGSVKQAFSAALAALLITAVVGACSAPAASQQPAAAIPQASPPQAASFAASADPMPSNPETNTSSTAASPSPTPDPSRTTSPAPDPTLTAKPTATPAPAQSVEVMVNDFGPDFGAGPMGMPITTGDHVDIDVKAVITGLDRNTCTLVHDIEPDKPGVAPTSVALTPAATQRVALIDGRHTFVATCKGRSGPVSSQFTVVATDGQPERSLGFNFVSSTITASTLQDVSHGIVGTWEGCVTTPWVPAYWVTMTFRAEGTYSATSTEVLDDQAMIALYYGSNDDSPLKRYVLNDFQDNRQAIGDIDLVFGDSAIRDDLRHVTLMGNQLSFELFHRGTYGPVTFQLHRK